MLANLTLATFDRTQRTQTQVARPETYRQLVALLRASGSTIARGAGLSCSAASFGADALSIDLTRFDRILSHDDSSGRVVVEPGVTIGDLTRFLEHKGRYLPALPGYPSITIGGCVAFDVHGKSQFHSGNFGEWVEELTLLHGDHGELSCSPSHEAELFLLTVGGAGLTGVIVRVALRTLPLPGRAIETTSVRARNLREAADILHSRAAAADCLYSWNDLNKRGASFGAGIVYVERFVADAASQAGGLPPRARNIAAELPLCAWNQATTRLALAIYGRLESNKRVQVRPLWTAMFPIHGKELYYAAFGGAGFREYQLIVPLPHWSDFVGALEQTLVTCRVPITLGSLKLFRGEPSMLKFRGTGICLAIDVPAHARSLALFSALDGLAERFSATVNLCKDSRLTGATCQRLFPEYTKFRGALRRFDPALRCQSSLRAATGV